MKIWTVRLLATVLLLGGMFGMGMAFVMAFATFIKDTGIGMIITAVFAAAFMALFAWSVHISMLMFTGNPKAWRRAIVLYATQIPIVFNGRIHYEWFTGLQLGALFKLIGHTLRLGFGLRLGADSFLELLRSHSPPYYGVNLFALAATILLIREQRKRIRVKRG